MRLKTFRAPTMADAMAQVRADLGAEALILNTRRTGSGVEITAALEPAPDPDPPAPPSPERLAALTWHGVPAALHPGLAHSGLADALVRTLAFGALPLDQGDPPVMLTGPPGAGKTLTAVRLATRLVMAGAPPILITTDGKRAGAMEQLAAFTRLLRIPLLVASQPISLARALARRTDGAPVLIDTAGADPFDPAQAEELQALATTAGAHVALVLPAGLDPAEAADIAAAHAALGATSLIITRLDLARRMGGVVAAAAARLTLTEAGISPNAADGMVPLTADFLADRLRSPERADHVR
jgi:flagellar biosynthesis protein FlhF